MSQVTGFSPTLREIKRRFREEIIDTHTRFGQDTITISKSALLEVATLLKEHPELQYNCLMDISAVDYWKRRPRFEVVYHFLSLRTLFRVRVKVPVAGSNPEVESLTSFWPSANWYEREVFDMFGIRFKGHPNLRRILLYPEFQGHPLRKDYPINKRQPRVGPKD